MQSTVLVVPGYRGSGPDHWQSWLEQQHPDARRVSGIDWEAPVLARWAAAVRIEIDRAGHAVWLVAHSFGCLAAVVGAADRADRVAGALLVAPADPARFSPMGVLARPSANPAATIAPWLPGDQLGFPSVVVASSDDPWMAADRAARWAEAWGSHFLNLGDAGHINPDAGFGPWPEGLELLRAMQAVHGTLPLGEIGQGRPRRLGRGGALTRIRHRTRSDLGY